MNYPISIYYGRRSEITPSRINWCHIEGLDQPELYFVMKRKEPGQKTISINKPIAKNGSSKERTELALFRQGHNVSGLFEPDTTHPGYGYGDINNRHDAILTIRDEKAGTLKVMVFEGLGKQSKNLFLSWITNDGGVCETMSNNKLTLSTDFVTESHD